MKKVVLNVDAKEYADFFQRIGYEVEFFDVDVSYEPKKAEQPRNYARRVAEIKAAKIQEKVKNTPVISVHRVISVGRRIIPLVEKAEDAFETIKFLSGRNHKVFVSICLILPDGTRKNKIAEAIIKFKGLSDSDIKRYLAKKENWYNCLGAYNIEREEFASLVKSIKGSYGAVSKIPLYELECILKGC